PKDPFVRINNTSNMTYELFAKVTEEKLPATVKYYLTDEWVEIKPDESQTDNNIHTYKYKKDIAPNFNGDVYILKDNKVEVSEKYVGDGKFLLSFDAWLAQKKPE
ncbi:MAG: hypothetical protein J1E41_07625, partial [Ruminococcus sp.]|nr:hypothetical protein [Ruminococcus sp.]